MQFQHTFQCIHDFVKYCPLAILHLHDASTATTRAEKELYLTESKGYSAQIGQGKYPSRFITEIKRSLFVTEGEME